MFSRLQNIEKRFNEIGNELCNSEVFSDQNKYRMLMKEHKNLEPIVEKYKE